LVQGRRLIQFHPGWRLQFRLTRPIRNLLNSSKKPTALGSWLFCFKGVVVGFQRKMWLLIQWLFWADCVFVYCRDWRQVLLRSNYKYEREIWWRSAFKLSLSHLPLFHLSSYIMINGGCNFIERGTIPNCMYIEHNWLSGKFINR
jgi:hypothetical protein